jgi:monoamine oxidase
VPIAADRFNPLLNRRNVLKLAGAGLVASVGGSVLALGDDKPARRAKRVVVAGGGIGGLCCAYELFKRGHDVTLLEASGRTGGHVRTIRDPLPDGLYADIGAEHFTNPGYDRFRKYVEEFNLPVLAYPRRVDMLRQIDGKWYTEEQLQDREVLKGFDFNAREIDFISKHGWTELPLLFFGPYLDDFSDEYQPFGVGHDKLDQISVGELMEKDGATDAALRFCGIRRSDDTESDRENQVSALYQIWQFAIMKLRKLPVFNRDVYRIQGGLQVLTDEFAFRLGHRVQLGCPVVAIERGQSAVSVHFIENNERKTIEAEHLVCALPLTILRRIPIAPNWPEDSLHVIHSMQFRSIARVVHQTRTPFWKGDVSSINLESDDAAMYQVYEFADEVPGDRCVLMGSGRPNVTSAEALAAFRGFYPGKASMPIEQTIVKNWSKDQWTGGCERFPFPLGQLHRFWPHTLQPVGRIHFAACHADNLPWGMDAATRAGYRVAEAIDRA